MFSEVGSHAVSVGNNNELEIKKNKNKDKVVRLAGA
jgi:hypothetical protein